MNSDLEAGVEAILELVKDTSYLVKYTDGRTRTVDKREADAMGKVLNELKTKRESYERQGAPRTPERRLTPQERTFGSFGGKAESLPRKK